MSAVAEHPHLRVVDTDSGEVLNGCPRCEEMEDEIAGLQRDIRGWAHRYADLKRERDQKAKASALWPLAMKAFDYWRLECRHPKSGWDTERFALIEPFLLKDGVEFCLRAIAGIAFDPFVTTRKNGSAKRHDGWHLVFKNRDKFEEYCNRAPRDWKAPEWVADLNQAEDEAGPSTGGTATSERPEALAQSELNIAV